MAWWGRGLSAERQSLKQIELFLWQNSSELIYLVRMALACFVFHLCFLLPINQTLSWLLAICFMLSNMLSAEYMIKHLNHSVR